ncbi:extracellular solute-binding protein [Vibrio sp.]|uniref:extracellular solute-binding protein n=1 Tax=Vibrio sp. TaxID=678 RepID=UPI003D11EAF3
MRHTNIAIALTAALLAGHAVAEEQVNIYNWSDYISSETIPEFEKATGINVRYDMYDSIQMAETKLLTGNSGYDVVVYDGSNPKVKQQIQAGAFQKLDLAKLPNYKNLSEQSKKWVSVYDEKKEYGVPYLWGTIGIGYNPDLVKKYAGNVPTDSWSMLLDPEVASKLGQCGLTLIDEPIEVYAATLSYLGKDPSVMSSENLKLVETHLKKIRPYITYFSSSKIISSLANGDVCVSQGYSGDVMIARDRADEADKGVHVSYSIPKEGSIVFFDAMYIPRDAKNIDQAHKFINNILEPKVGAAQSNYVFFASPNKEATPYLLDEVKNDPGIYPSDQVVDKLYPKPEYDSKFGRKLMRMWNSFKAG